MCKLITATELVLTCPFCGEQPACEDYEYLGHFVTCDNSACSVNPSANGGEDESLEAAIKKWNTRV